MSATRLLMLNTDVVSGIFTVEMAYASQVAAFTALADGAAWQPDKIGGAHPGDSSTVFCYAARLGRDTGPISKFGSVNPGNPARGLPSIHATVVLLDPETGVPVAILDGTAITALRTAAASAVAATHLARRTDRIAVVGSGRQGVAHLRSLHNRFPSAAFSLWSPNTDEVQQAVKTACAESISVAPATTIDAAVDGAAVIVTATQAIAPLFGAEALAPDALVISIGSFEEHRCEVGPDVLDASAAVVVDHAATARSHSGPLVAARRRGTEIAITELGSVLVGTADVPDIGRATYLSVGLGVQDAAAAWSIYRAAVESGEGHTVKW